MAEWLAHRNSNSNSSTALTAGLELFLGRPQFRPQSSSTARKTKTFKIRTAPQSVARLFNAGLLVNAK